MGTTFSSIHILSNEAPQISYFEFKSFSNGWQTCINIFSDWDPNYLLNAAKLISKQTSSPVLCYYIFDSEYIHFEFLQNGKLFARYSDDEFVSNKNLYGIPPLLGYASGYKKRLSNILGCSDAEEKNDLLEEYFGVCLLPFPECFSDHSTLIREKSDILYTEFIENEIALTGPKAPISLDLITEQKGKIFWDYFGKYTKKEHCYLFGYDVPNSKSLKPVRFCGEQIKPISTEEFDQNRIPLRYQRDFYEMEYGATSYALFNDLAPASYTNKKMKMPNGFFPLGFDTKNRLVLHGQRKIYIADESMNIIAKKTIKGDCADMVGDFILTYSGDSFCGYEYEPKATIRIYRLIEKKPASV